MGPLAIAGAALVGWLWWTGRISARTLLPLLTGALALTFLLRGQFLPAGIAALVAAFTGLGSRRRMPADPMAARIAEAERLLGLEPGYGRAELEAAYRRAAKRAHPDAGGSGEAMEALSTARALLSAELERRRSLEEERGS